MARLLFHILSGPENTTKAALGLLVAKTAQAEGHDVVVFFAGDGVDYVRTETRAVAVGVGVGSVADHYQALAESDARLFGSAISANARGVSTDGNVELVKPARLVELIVEADKVIVY
jgi:predicted peroxiredoxin